MWLILAAAMTAEPGEHMPIVQGAEFTFSPMDGVYQALADIQLAPEDGGTPKEYRQFVRWIWLPGGGSVQSRGFAMFAAHNSVNRGSFFDGVYPAGNGQLVRLRLDELAPKIDRLTGKRKDLEELVLLWERMAQTDTAFWVLQPMKEYPTAPYIHANGKTVNTIWKRIALPGEQIEPFLAKLLQGFTSSNVPIVSYDHFSLSVMNQVRTAGVDGLYYEFKKIKGQSFDDFANAHGVNVKQFNDLDATRRAAVACSGVANKPRAVNVAQGPFGAFAWTEDTSDDTVDDNGEKDPIRTLIDSKFDASEVRAMNVLGLIDDALFNGKGVLTNSVPDGVTHDSLITGPGTSRLQPPSSCVVCHADADGFKTLKNDALRFSDGAKIEIVKGKPLRGGVFFLSEDDRAKFRSLYRNNLKELDTVGRLPYSGAVFKASGGMTVQEIGQEQARVRAVYGSNQVTPERAVLDLGFTITEAEEPKKPFKKLAVPEIPRSRRIAIEILKTYLPAEDGLGEDPYILLLKDGTPITTQSWRQSRPYAMQRVGIELDLKKKYAEKYRQLLESLPKVLTP